MNSALILLNPPEEFPTQDLGAVSFKTWPEVHTAIASGGVGVLGIFTEETRAEKILREIARIAVPEPHIVLVAPRFDDVAWERSGLERKWFRVFAERDQQNIVMALRAALEAWQEHKQQVDLTQLMSDQNERLTAAQPELEQHIRKRQATLTRAQKRLQRATQISEVLQTAFLAVHKARSLLEMETLLMNALKQTLPIESLNLRYHSQSAITQSTADGGHERILRVPLNLGPCRLGEMLVSLGSLTRLEQKHALTLLHRVSEPAALGLDRIAKLDQAETIKQQWQATFDAISEPLCLVDSSERILRTNQAYATASGRKFADLSGANGFEPLLGKGPLPKPEAAQTARFRAERQVPGAEPRTYEVTIMPAHFADAHGDVSMILFQDVTHRLVLERRLVEASKLAELGLIGSSIAHELNNPLGGMLTFIQLLKMGLKGGEPYREDILEMEAAALRSRDIVQNLLGFARRSDPGSRDVVSLRSLVDQAVRLTELKTRSQGIDIQVEETGPGLSIKAQANQITQALCNILQNSGEAILSKRADSQRFAGAIKVNLSRHGQRATILIQDNGVGVPKQDLEKVFNPLFSTKSPERNPGLGLTVAHRILTDHDGELEILSQPGVGTTVKVTLPLAQDLG